MEVLLRLNSSALAGEAPHRTTAPWFCSTSSFVVRASHLHGGGALFAPGAEFKRGREHDVLTAAALKNFARCFGLLCIGGTTITRMPP